MKTPDEASLREAALAHLSRFAATEASLARVLYRRVDRWARQAEAAGQEPEFIQTVARSAKAAIPKVIAAARGLGAVDDAAFAASRARRLTRAGKSRRAALAHLAAKGVDPELAAETLPEDAGRDLAAACAYLKRRRLPPFAEADEAARMKALASLARAGYSRDVAERALDLDGEAAESLLLRLRQPGP
ncbi:MAG TPA: RecX family transcriptional regulator [Acetobacteraceae bacterium]|nr:RecX family transcriptional regulator [Acetobacteraceae bacterium]